MNNAVFVIFVNFVAALGIVFANKWLFRSIHFPPVTLMAFHFLSTFIVLLALRLCGIFKVKRISVIRILPLRNCLKSSDFRTDVTKVSLTPSRDDNFADNLEHAKVCPFVAQWF